MQEKCYKLQLLFLYFPISSEQSSDSFAIIAHRFFNYVLYFKLVEISRYIIYDLYDRYFAQNHKKQGKVQ